MELNPIDKQKLAIRIALLAGIFSCIVGVILLLNYWQLRQSDPLESKLMETLVKQLSGDRQNEVLKEEIRNLDLMARKAYFTKQWQIRAGGYLLVGGMVVLVAALRIFYSLRSRIAEPDASDLSLKTELLISRRWILSVIFVLFGMALLAAFLSDDHLAGSYVLAGPEGDIPEQAVEEISITPVVSGAETDMTGTADGEETQSETDMEEAVSVKDQDPVGIEDEIMEDKPESGITETPEVLPAKNTAGELKNNFPSFRGPYGQGVTLHRNIPLDWDGQGNRNIIWKIQVPNHGYNSPVLWGDDLYLTGADQNTQVVYCYNRHTGSINWQHPVDGIQRPAGEIRKPTDDTGYAAPTIATDGRFITAIFASGDVACLDMEGKRVWGRNLGIPDNHYGHSSSLLIWNDLLLVQFDGNKAGKVLALDLPTGEEKWSTIRESKISWASPILIDLGGNYELILSSAPHVAGYDPLTGEERWAVECLSGEVGPSPAFWNGIVFAANEYAKLLAIKPGDPPEVLWETNEYLPEVSSPVAAGGLLFVATSYGVIACYDAMNGEILWEYECDQGIYASPIIADGKVYFLDMDGKMHIFKMDRTMNLLGVPELGESTVSTPAFAEGNIYIRGSEYLYCIGNK
ncbi:MAG: PQQ-binding-like beta-propeller repeat protein [Cyclobacteriaceae bacterium]|nr:PQQ-binding-like beta-propeller repeat protein [Cyclobacteriaceae bacterium]